MGQLCFSNRMPKHGSKPVVSKFRKRQRNDLGVPTSGPIPSWPTAGSICAITSLFSVTTSARRIDFVGITRCRMKPRLLLATLLTLPLMAADWPQWRGPNRDGVSKETGLLKEWPKDGPKLLWTYKKAGAGYSCPAIVGDRLYTMGARDADEYLICLDIKDPAAVNELWAVKIGPM